MSNDDDDMPYRDKYDGDDSDMIPPVEVALDVLALFRAGLKPPSPQLAPVANGLFEAAAKALTYYVGKVGES